MYHTNYVTLCLFGIKLNEVFRISFVKVNYMKVY